MMRREDNAMLRLRRASATVALCLLASAMTARAVRVGAVGDQFANPEAS
jgi:hypothetical protein